MHERWEQKSGEVKKGGMMVIRYRVLFFIVVWLSARLCALYDGEGKSGLGVREQLKSVRKKRRGE